MNPDHRSVLEHGIYGTDNLELSYELLASVSAYLFFDWETKVRIYLTAHVSTSSDDIVLFRVDTVEIVQFMQLPLSVPSRTYCRDLNRLKDLLMTELSKAQTLSFLV